MTKFLVSWKKKTRFLESSNQFLRQKLDNVQENEKDKTTLMQRFDYNFDILNMRMLIV
jgi:hypothetical protein